MSILDSLTPTLLDDFDATLARLVELGAYVKAGERQHIVQCPHPDHPDLNPSATMRRGDRGQAVLHCFTCSQSNRPGWIGQVLTRLVQGEPFQVAKPKSSPGNGGQARGQRVAFYEYRDASGNPYRKTRFETEGGGKSFEWARKIGDAWATGFGHRRIEDLLPYRAEHLPAGLVYWVEGEKDADRLAEMGVAVVTSGGGAGGPLPIDLSALAGRDVAVIADLDPAGVAYARRVAAALDGIATTVHIVRPAIDTTKADVSDHLDAGHSLGDLIVVEGDVPLPTQDDEEDDRAPVIEREVFDATQELSYIRDLARARMVSPWALLAVFLARAIVHISPEVTVPAFIGSRASLNQMFALVGESGAGKSTLVGAADEVFPFASMDIITANPSSGEGLVSLFVDIHKGECTQVADKAISIYDEIGTLGAQQDRNGSTLASILRTAWSGGMLSTFAADKDRRRKLGSHTYRYVVLMGVQLTTAHVLLDDVGAGTPQRVVWLPATDPHAPEVDVEEPPGNPFHGWRVPVHGPTVTYPAGVREYVRSNRRAQLRGDTAAEDGHAVLARLKLAAALAVLHRQSEVSEQVWEVAGWVMSMSDRTRQRVMDARAAEAGQRAEAAGEIEARKEDARNRMGLERAVMVIAKYVHRHPDGASRRQVKDACGRWRMVAGEAIESAIERGFIVRLDGPGQGTPSVRYYPGAVKP
jgi:energy-coupling factor transporter ATP-binding protein EcfA2